MIDFFGRNGTCPGHSRYLKLFKVGIMIAIKPVMAGVGMAVVLALATACTTYLEDFDYVTLLRSSPDYAAGQDASLGAFSHDPPGDSQLATLEASYGLLAKAGSGSARSKVENLMQWLQEAVTFDGSVMLPPQRDALSLLRSGAALNCLGAAICLGEALLAVGVPARVLTLEARDLSNDRHVVVMAWSAEQRTWIMADPSYNTLYLDSQGQAMSPLEVREAVRSGTEWQYSPQASWNGEPLDGAGYRHYLSKNLYYFSCTQRAQAGARGVLGRVMVYLTPLGGDGTWVPFLATRITHSPASFFAAP